MTSDVVPNRILEARESRAMSMEDLANKVGVTRQSISKYEKGIISPSPETLQAISITLNFPIDFFFKEDCATTKNSSLFFRSKSNIPLKVKNACIYQIKWTNEMKNRLFLQYFWDRSRREGITLWNINRPCASMNFCYMILCLTTHIRYFVLLHVWQCDLLSNLRLYSNL